VGKSWSEAILHTETRQNQIDASLLGGRAKAAQLRVGKNREDSMKTIKETNGTKGKITTDNNATITNRENAKNRDK